jgi:hypothetical protein
VYSAAAGKRPSLLSSSLYAADIQYSFLFLPSIDTLLLHYSSTLSFITTATTTSRCCTVHTRILEYLYLHIPLPFRRGDPCFVCMDENDPAQHCTSQKEALGCLANTALVDYTRHSSTSVRPPKLTTSSPHINYYFRLSPPSLILLFLLQLFPSPSTKLLSIYMLESTVSPSHPSDPVYGLSHDPRLILSFRQYRAVSVVDRRSESLIEPLPPFGRTQLVPAAAIAE